MKSSKRTVYSDTEASTRAACQCKPISARFAVSASRVGWPRSTLCVATCVPFEYNSSAVGVRCARSRLKSRCTASDTSQRRPPEKLAVLKSRSGPIAPSAASTCARSARAAERTDVVDARATFGAVLVHLDAHAAFVFGAWDAVGRGEDRIAAARER